MAKRRTIRDRLGLESVAEPGGTIDRVRPRAGVLSLEAVLGAAVEYILTHIVPVPTVTSLAIAETLVAFYLVGFVLIVSGVTISYFWLWKPVKQIREDKSKLWNSLNEAVNLLQKRAMGEDRDHIVTGWEDMRQTVLGNAIGTKVVSCLEDVKELGDASFVAMLVLIPVFVFGAYFVPIVGFGWTFLFLFISSIAGFLAYFRIVYSGKGWYGVGEWKRQISALYDKSRLTNATEEIATLLKSWAKTHPSKYPIFGGFSK